MLEVKVVLNKPAYLAKLKVPMNLEPIIIPKTKVETPQDGFENYRIRFN